MRSTRNVFSSFASTVILIGTLPTSAVAELRHKYPAQSKTIVSQPVDDGWDSDLDSSWGYDHSINPNVFGQNSYGPNGDFAYGGFGCSDWWC